MIILENLLGKFRTCNDYEYMGAHHMTHVPSLGSLAYLNIIHKASDPDIQTGIIDPLHLPDEIREFYRSYNGADLFSDTMSIDGFFPHVYRYERTDMRRSYPYNIMDLNDMFANNVQSSKIFLFGSYGHDRSPIFVERSTGRIHCVSGANPKYSGPPGGHSKYGSQRRLIGYPCASTSMAIAWSNLKKCYRGSIDH